MGLDSGGDTGFQEASTLLKHFMANFCHFSLLLVMFTNLGLIVKNWCQEKKFSRKFQSVMFFTI